MKALKIITAILALSLIGLIVYAVNLYHDESRVEYDPRVNYLHEKEADTLRVLGRAGSYFESNITLIEYTDPDGNYYFVGEIDPFLDSYLDDLVDAYNADPETTKPIALEELRYCLTDGLAEATELGKHESNFWQFLQWCDTPVYLVYSEDVYNDSGEKEYSVGEPLQDKNTYYSHRYTMYDYITKKDLFLKNAVILQE